MTQEELLPLIYKKDDKAFTIFYDTYAKSLLGVISAFLKDQEEAEDALQEAFIKIWKNIETYDESKGRLFTWIVTMARNTAIEKLGSKNNTTNIKNLTTDNFVHLLDSYGAKNTKIDTIGIQEFVKKLKPKCIKMIDLLFFKGFSQQEASEELDIPLGTMKNQNRNCIQELRTLLQLS
jgi:RNA polymerase sigma-70 factor (ECF subfamily)